jgi:hypothetical protein
MGKEENREGKIGRKGERKKKKIQIQNFLSRSVMPASGTYLLKLHNTGRIISCEKKQRRGSNVPTTQTTQARGTPIRITSSVPRLTLNRLHGVTMPEKRTLHNHGCQNLYSYKI